MGDAQMRIGYSASAEGWFCEPNIGCGGEWHYESHSTGSSCPSCPNGSAGATVWRLPEKTYSSKEAIGFEAALPSEEAKTLLEICSGEVGRAYLEVVVALCKLGPDKRSQLEAVGALSKLITAILQHPPAV